MKMFVAGLTLGLVLLVSPVLAQDGGGGGQPVGEDEEYDMEAALRKVAKLLKESESSLAKSLEGPKEEAAEAGQSAKKAIDELLKKSQSNGEEAARMMTEILENAPCCQGGGQGQKQKETSEQEKDAQKESEKEVGERNPRNSANGDPNSPEENKTEPNGSRKPPESKLDKPAEPNPDDDWRAMLPEKIRQAVKNGEWDKIPPKWRELIQEYTKRMAEIESSRKKD